MTAERSDADRLNKMLPEGLSLVTDEQGLCLTDGRLTMRGDLTAMLPRLRRDNLQRELLVRAARTRMPEGGVPVALDATAGMGEDSLLLAAAGFRVELYEYDPVIAALLRDALRRASGVPGLAGAAGRMHLHEGDSIAAMLGLAYRPDVILLDPMFPERQKSALIKKKFQLIHRLERPCEDEAQLLRAAISASPAKLVIKRPLKGPYLAGVKPDHSLPGKAVRYDVFVRPADRHLRDMLQETD